MGRWITTWDDTGGWRSLWVEEWPSIPLKGTATTLPVETPALLDRHGRPLKTYRPRRQIGFVIEEAQK